MLYSAGIIRVVAGFFRRGRRPPLVVDPVMISTSGAKLLQRSAIKVLEEQLLPLAALVTPNLHEAEILASRRLNSLEDLQEAAHEIHRRFGCSVLVKGGHLRGVPDAMDAFYDGQRDILLAAPRVRGVSTHGTGCVYSAAIAGCLAAGHSLPRAIELAKRFITRAIARSGTAGRHPVLDFGGR
jgi:hydroxymethylpyrimidine kinase/phosphomethylpyrimidine kinase